MDNEITARVFALADAQGRLIRLEGELTLPSKLSGWVLIDEGEWTYKRAHAQTNWLPKPIMEEDGIYNYKLEGTEILERTDEEKDADRPAPQPTALEALEAQVLYTALMTDTLIEEVV